MKTASIKKTGLGILIGVLLMIGVQSVSAWTAPTNPPVGGNVVAPVNTGTNQQFKNGTLSALHLFTLELGAFSGFIPAVGISVDSAGFKIFDGVTPTPGEVLTVDANNVATWQPSGGISGGTINQTVRHDGTHWTAVSNLSNFSSKVKVFRGAGTGVFDAPFEINLQPNQIPGGPSINMSRLDFADIMVPNGQQNQNVVLNTNAKGFEVWNEAGNKYGDVRAGSVAIPYTSPTNTTAPAVGMVLKSTSPNGNAGTAEWSNLAGIMDIKVVRKGWNNPNSGGVSADTASCSSVGTGYIAISGGVDCENGVGASQPVYSGGQYPSTYVTPNSANPGVVTDGDPTGWYGKCTGNGDLWVTAVCLKVQ